MFSRLSAQTAPRHLVLAALLLTFAALPAAAQDSALSIGLLGGVGGSPDAAGYDGASLQAVVSWEWRLRTRAQLRIGQLGVDLDTDLDGFELSSDLTWLGLSTEYRYHSDFYESGYIIGIGYYTLDADSLALPGLGLISDIDEDAIGLHLGVSGHFRLAPRWTLPVEIMGHYADFDAAQIFLTAQAGIAYRF